VIPAEHFGAKIFILRQTVPNLSSVKLCAFFSGTPCRPYIQTKLKMQVNHMNS